MGLSDGRGKLAKYDGLLWDGIVLLLAVVHVVHPNAQQLLWVVDGGLECVVCSREDVL